MEDAEAPSVRKEAVRKKGPTPSLLSERRRRFVPFPLPQDRDEWIGGGGYVSFPLQEGGGA
eukprot:22764-Pyramimonas_sp.AAC.1